MGKKHKLSLKKRRQRTLLAAVALFLLMIISIITLAFFTSKDEVTNRFNATIIDIALKEPHWNPEEAKNVVPEMVLNKDPYISNVDEVAAYVYLKVTVPYANLYIESSDVSDRGTELASNPGTEVPLYKFGTRVGNTGIYTYNTNYDAGQNINSGWYLVGCDKDISNEAYIYVYAHVEDYGHTLLPLIEGHTTQYPLFDTIKVMNFNEKNFDYDRDYSVRVEAYGIQTDYLKDGGTSTDPLEVWKIIDPDCTWT